MQDVVVASDIFVIQDAISDRFISSLWTYALKE